MVCRNIQRRRLHRVTRWSIVERLTRVQTKINLFYLASHISMHRPLTGGFDRLEGRWPKISPTRKCHKGLDLMNPYHGAFIQMIESPTWPTGNPTRGMRTTDFDELVLMAPLVWQLGSWYIPGAEPNRRGSFRAVSRETQSPEYTTSFTSPWLAAYGCVPRRVLHGLRNSGSLSRLCDG
jgi:hypothetical protein